MQLPRKYVLEYVQVIDIIKTYKYHLRAVRHIRKPLSRDIDNAIGNRISLFSVVPERNQTAVTWKQLGKNSMTSWTPGLWRRRSQTRSPRAYDKMQHLIHNYNILPTAIRLIEPGCISALLHRYAQRCSQQSSSRGTAPRSNSLCEDIDSSVLPSCTTCLEHSLLFNFSAADTTASINLCWDPFIETAKVWTWNGVSTVTMVVYKYCT